VHVQILVSCGKSGTLKLNFSRPGNTEIVPRSWKALDSRVKSCRK